MSDGRTGSKKLYPGIVKSEFLYIEGNGDARLSELSCLKLAHTRFFKICLGFACKFSKEESIGERTLVLLALWF